MGLYDTLIKEVFVEDIKEMEKSAAVPPVIANAVGKVKNYVSNIYNKIDDKRVKKLADKIEAEATPLIKAELKKPVLPMLGVGAGLGAAALYHHKKVNEDPRIGIYNNAQKVRTPDGRDITTTVIRSNTGDQLDKEVGIALGAGLGALVGYKQRKKLIEGIMNSGAKEKLKKELINRLDPVTRKNMITTTALGAVPGYAFGQYLAADTRERDLQRDYITAKKLQYAIATGKLKPNAGKVDIGPTSDFIVLE